MSTAMNLISRRDLLTMSGLSMGALTPLGLALPKLLASQNAKASQSAKASQDSDGAQEEIWKQAALRKPPSMRWLDKTSPVRSLVFENEPYRGKRTEVFAFFATPGTLSGDASKDEKLPAVVLLHGGGGTAFAEWTQLWAKRGYAAIAMDLCGGRPPSPKFDSQDGRITNLGELRNRANRKRDAFSGPPEGAVNKFQTVGGDLTDDWQYHAVAAAMRAHSLIRSFPQVDERRTAVTGISWGGYLTCLVASIDERFKAAAPVYGCGFIHDGESVQRRQVDALSEKQQADWIRLWEPSVWLPKCRVPILFVNGANDVHYPLDSYLRTYDLVPGFKQMRIEVGMRHSHVHGWAPKEIGRFIDQHLRGGSPLPLLGQHRVEGGEINLMVKSGAILKASLHFTEDDGLLSKRRWKQVPAAVKGQRVSAKTPQNATICLLSVTDKQGAMVSSRPIFLSRR